MHVDPAQLDELFAAALEKTAPADRAAFVDQATADNPDLRERVDALLAAHAAAGSFLRLPADDATAAFVALSERPGSVVGRYKLLEQIGEGGFGVVFMAEQEQPVRRRVALKVIKLGMDTKQVVARFEAERQALAMMDHPNIAKVFDAGATDTGRPYFVMELVRGVPITTYCDESRMTTNDRLVLFQSVCAAVQHAHQKGIIHRDLKPSNILVTMHDEAAVPKVIDFGVAKATQARLTERTLFTEFRQMIGTPSYMSPEQAQMSGLDADTRSDVYSLGVLLYELLTGTTPIDATKLQNSTYDDLRRLICEVDPPSPSARLSTLSEAEKTQLSERRQCDAHSLSLHLRSDLDWIVMKCLEKDRRRRYESASALALDLKRYLDGEPVQARPPTSWYRIQKFVGRNRVGVFFSASLAVLTAALLALAAISYSRIQRESAEREAAIHDKDAALAGKTEALRERIAALSEKEAALQSAQRSEQVALGRFYAAQMNLAAQSFKNGDVARTVQLLDTLRPRAGENDLRGFEWRHLFHLTHSNSIRTWKGAQKVVVTIDWSPDGSLIANPDFDCGLIRLWDAQTGDSKGRIKTDRVFFWDIGFAKQGELLVGGSEAGDVYVWDIKSRREIRRWKVHPIGHGIRSLAVSHDGTRIATSAFNDNRELPNAVVELWDVNGQLQHTLDCQPETVYSISFSPDDKLLAAATSAWGTTNVVIWKLESKPLRIGSIPGIGGDDLVFSDDNRTLWLTDDVFKPGSPSIHEIDVDTTTIRRTLKGHTAVVSAVQLLHDGRGLVSISSDRTVRVWDTQSGESKIVGAELSYIASLALDPQGNRVVTGDRTGQITMRDLNHSSAIPTWRGEGLNFLQFTTDSRHLLAGGSSLALLNSDTLKLEERWLHGKCVTASQDGQLLVAAPERSPIQIVDQFGEAVSTLSERGAIDRARFSPDGRYVATWKTNGDTSLKLWETQTGQFVADLSERTSYHAVFSPNSKFLVVTRFEGFRIYDLGNRKWVEGEVTVGNNMTLLVACFSPRGNLLAVGLGDGAAVLYDFDQATGAVALNSQLQGNTMGISSMTFSPDGQMLVTACADQTIRTWDVELRQERVTLDLQLHLLATLLEFSPDGNRLAILDCDNVVQVLLAGELQSDAREAMETGDASSPAVGPR